ncbi:hypothetical protein BT93_L5280 [Corymbia citriodora subsp. variegata]|uniref:Prolamin-like domain-containing protein n=1 Tax=Corymbia citriodora subsp. variegata TaxID=360336 RepID=A0A8T0CSI2_CORYI|nr:hypothetical protein BT93_L5280 [Corymbia citriodora subsp. variegata]
MAMLKNLYALMILSVVTTVTLLPRATFAIDGTPDCAKGMTFHCGSGFYQIIVLADTFTPSNECCGQLLKAGKNCHNKFVESIVSNPKQIRGTIPDVYKRGNETWNNCVAAISPVSPPELAH